MAGMMSLVLSTLLQASGTTVCAMSTGYVPFEISKDAQPLQAPDNALDAPRAELVSVTRGVGGAAGSCDAQGILVLSVKAKGGSYKADDLGFEFAVRGDGDAGHAFPARAVAIGKDNARNELLLTWPDDAPAQQKPLQLDVEVRAVTHGDLLGPATVLHIDTRPADVVRAEAKARADAEREQEKAAKAAEKEHRKLAREQSDD